MKSMKMILPIGLLFLVATSCQKHFGTIKGKGNNVTEIRSVTNFNKIKLDMDADVTYVQDSIFYVEISAQSNLMSVIKTTVSAGELRIENTKWIRKHNPITFIIHSPTIVGMTVSGSGNINANGAITTGSMDLKISGSGNISLYSLQSGEFDATISGSGNISVVNGTVNNQRATISGSGNIETLNLTSANANAKISGSGDISIRVTQLLDAMISGSGDIIYAGSAAVNATISGSGSVTHI
ncbi:MAG TPA: head GIN domain-containing protein [Fluviicola sp.]|nr:head GIN domain-containing protein [Fluviicola sp.]